MHIDCWYCHWIYNQNIVKTPSVCIKNIGISNEMTCVVEDPIYFTCPWTGKRFEGGLSGWVDGWVGEMCCYSVWYGS